MGTAPEMASETENRNDEFSEEPTVIHLGINESYRKSDDLDDDDSSYKKSTLRKRPKDNTLHKFSVISCILGILACTIFLGNLPIAVIGILFGITAEANRYTNVYTKIGLICCAISCLISFALAVAIAVFTFVFIFVLFVALLALLALCVLIAVFLLPFITAILFAI